MVRGGGRSCRGRKASGGGRQLMGNEGQLGGERKKLFLSFSFNFKSVETNEIVPRGEKEKQKGKKKLVCQVMSKIPN